MEKIFLFLFFWFILECWLVGPHVAHESTSNRGGIFIIYMGNQIAISAIYPLAAPTFIKIRNLELDSVYHVNPHSLQLQSRLKY